MPSDPNESPSPNPSRSPNQPPAAGSPPASGTPSASEEFVADTGPEFDPESVAAAPPPLEPEPELTAAIEWEEDAIAGLLRVQGRLTHAGIGVASEDSGLFGSGLRGGCAAADADGKRE